MQQLRDHLLKALEAAPVLTGPSSSPVRAIGSQQSDAAGTDPGPSDPRVASLEADVAYYKELADVQRGEAEEAKHTLGGAIVSNAKMASFFEEIQVRFLWKARVHRLQVLVLLGSFRVREASGEQLLSGDLGEVLARARN